MKITFIKVEPNLQSINRELIFNFKVTDLGIDMVPISYRGELFLDNNIKIGNLNEIQNNSNVGLYARGGEKDFQNYELEIKFSCELSSKAIAYLEDYRASEKSKSKDIGFIVRFGVTLVESRICVSNLHVEKSTQGNDGRHNLFYQSVQNYRAPLSNLWLLSGDNGANFLNFRATHYEGIPITINLMQWVNNFMEYLGMQRSFVLEITLPDDHILSEEISERYEKAVQSLKDMKVNIDKCEWKYVILEARPIMELFKSFDEFKNLLIANGYTEQAWQDFRTIIQGTFDLLSKFVHALDRNRKDVMNSIPIHKEDADYIFIHSITLLSLIAEKSKRVAI